MSTHGLFATRSDLQTWQLCFPSEYSALKTHYSGLLKTAPRLDAGIGFGRQRFTRKQRLRNVRLLGWRFLHTIENALMDSLSCADSAWFAFEVERFGDATDQAHAVVKFFVGIALKAAWIFEVETRDTARVEGQAGIARRLQHPEQRDVGEIGVGVAAANVGVTAAEPNFFDLSHRRSGRVPKRGLKTLSFFVQRQGVGDALDVARIDSMKVAERAAEGQRAHGVPDADKIDHRVERAVATFIDQFAVHVGVVDLEQFLFFQRARLFRQAGEIDQSGETANREGAAAEAEAVNA